MKLFEFLQGFPMLENHVETQNFQRVFWFLKPFENKEFSSGFL